VDIPFLTGQERRVRGDDRNANGISSPPVPKLERIRAAAQDGGGFLVAQLVPQDELEGLAIAGPQPADRSTNLLVRVIGRHDKRIRRHGRSREAGMEAEPAALGASLVCDDVASHAKEPQPVTWRSRNMAEAAPCHCENLGDHIVGLVHSYPSADVSSDCLVVSRVERLKLLLAAATATHHVLLGSSSATYRHCRQAGESVRE